MSTKKISNKEIKLNLGSGIHLFKDFINVDAGFELEDLAKKEGIYKNAIVEPGAQFVRADICDLPFPKNFADYIECNDTIEHLRHVQIPTALFEMKRVLKLGGKLLITTVDFSNLAELWILNVKDKPFDPKWFYELNEIIYGNQATFWEIHRAVLTPQYFDHLLKLLAFSQYKITLFAKGQRPPTILTHPDNEESRHSVLRSDEILIEAFK